MYDYIFRIEYACTLCRIVFLILCAVMRCNYIVLFALEDVLVYVIIYDCLRRLHAIFMLLDVILYVIVHVLLYVNISECL